MTNVRIAAAALADLDDAFWFYEAQERGLGEYFAIHLRADIEGLKVTGGIHRQVHRGLHRALSRRFPYAIFYRYSGGTVLVVAVLDCRRDPDWIRDRLDE